MTTEKTTKKQTEPRKPKVYKLKQKCRQLAIGTLVYECIKPDYGVSNEDTSNFGYPCVSVTLNESGDYPFFTAPLKYLELVEDPSKKEKK